MGYNDLSSSALPQLQNNDLTSPPRTSRSNARDSRQNPITSQTSSAQSYRSISQQAYGSHAPSANQQQRADGQTDTAMADNSLQQDELLPKRLQQVGNLIFIFKTKMIIERRNCLVLVDKALDLSKGSEFESRKAPLLL